MTKMKEKKQTQQKGLKNDNAADRVEVEVERTNK